MGICRMKKKVALALQGGGSHGAFAWGVIEALLQDGNIEIEGFSGTSAGGMNATATVQGLVDNGNKGALECLEEYWRCVHELALQIAPLLADPIGKMRNDYNLRTSPAALLSPVIKPFLSQLSPYELNPYNYNPFRQFIESFFDFPKIQNETRWRLFLAATHVETGKIKIFGNQDISADALMATTCLPTLFHATEIDGEYYWDGGYIANPAIYPLINNCVAKDIVIVQLTKNRMAHMPRNKEQIVERFSEITFNACLVREIRAIYFITNLIDQGKINDHSMRRINLHIIKDNEFFSDLSAASAGNTDWDFLTRLRHAGFRAGQKWLRGNYELLGEDQPFSQNIMEEYI